MNKTSNLRRQFKMVLNRLFTISFDSGEAVFFCIQKLSGKKL